MRKERQKAGGSGRRQEAEDERQEAATIPPSAFRVPRSLVPPLKWAGGKRWLAPCLRALYEPHCARRLVEPFCGGLSVALALQPRCALLNDINPHAVNFYKWLQKNLRVEMPMRNDAALFYQHRACFNSLAAAGESEGEEAAALFYYLNRTGYNGLCRFNRKGEFNVPFGRYKSICYTSDFSAYATVLRDWEFGCGDFESVPVAPDDFIYADPPYDQAFAAYSSQGFDWNDQVRLARWLAAHDGPVVASNAATPRVEELYRGLGFNLSFVDAPRRIACNGDRASVREIVATKNL